MSHNHIHIGTSGFSYTEWIEAGFYPKGTKSAEMLGLYASIFGTAELNYTWYQMVRTEAMERMLARVPGDFLFAAKLTRTMTHEQDADWRRQTALYRQGIQPLVQGGKLAAVLVQLPPNFDRTAGNRAYLGALLDELAGLPLAVEFRHASWARDSVFRELEKRRITLVTVDEPDLPGLFPGLDVVTNPDLTYIRLHGRNQAGWRTGNMQKKFDYDYSPRELEDWLARYGKTLLEKPKQSLVFFNNHVRAQAPANASLFRKILAGNEK